MKIVAKMNDQKKWRLVRLPWSNEEILYAQQTLIDYVYSNFNK